MAHDVEIHWAHADGPENREDWDRVVYAILHPHTDELLYIGKAWGTTAGKRWNAQDKADFWGFVNRETEHHQFIVGEIKANQRLTEQLLADLEAILIFHLKPRGNLQGVESRLIRRAGLVIKNTGRAWPGPHVVTEAKN